MRGLVTAAYRDTFFPPDTLNAHGVALASARAGNAIGGGDWTEDQLIPDLVRAWLAGSPCPIRSPDAVRPWQFVLEPLRGYLILAEELSRDGAAHASGWNFGPADGDARPVSWIADRFTRLLGPPAAWAPDTRGHPAETSRLTLNASKAAAHLGWRPALPLQDALDWIVEWYQGYRGGADLGALTRSQIERYQRLPGA